METTQKSTTNMTTRLYTDKLQVSMLMKERGYRARLLSIQQGEGGVISFEATYSQMRELAQRVRKGEVTATLQVNHFFRSGADEISVAIKSVEEGVSILL